jgi:L-aspartate oxidase
MMGGVKCGLSGETNIEGLYAIGEASNSGVHGANRLASNSTLECVVYGRRSAAHINQSFKRCDKPIEYQNPGGKNVNFDPETKMNELKGIMVKHCGILRNEESLAFGLEYVTGLLAELKDAKITSVRMMELYNMAIVANQILKAAIARKESVGSHYREDYNDAK